MALTIGETIDKLHSALRQYVEATYHIGSPQLIDQRRALLDEPGVIHQKPFIESTPRYQSKESFADLGLDADVLAFFQALSKADKDSPPLVYDPPYEHQAAAIKGALVDKDSLLVMTGTGSGKTECFLLPILGKLAFEARHSAKSFASPAVRALVLYPMNALVNDQLGRLRLLFGNDRVVNQFMAWAGRPARFARYTSRTLYPGVRDSKKDGRRLKSIETFYINQLEIAAGPPSDEQARAAELIERLHGRGKWPAKADIAAWYGKKSTRWQNKAGEYIRGVTLPGDAEFITRHEVHEAPSDILVTNYSMLEYMMMRPLERPIFDATREWLDQNPHETFLLVVDESHMYRGAGGAEVALLLRRLRTRLAVPPERFQVICTSASFKDEQYAIEFVARLTGKSTDDFAPAIQGNLALRAIDGAVSSKDSEALANIDLDAFHEADAAAEKLAIVTDFLKHREISVNGAPIERLLHQALEHYSPMGELINRTMQAAYPIEEIGCEVFKGAPQKTADQAVTALATLGSLARLDPNQPSLLPCRVHAFYRGLPGLWVCLDADCTALPEKQRGKAQTGKLYAQPQDRCDCGARVLELFTCRNCGTAYARAYTDDLMDPQFLWSEPGSAFLTFVGSVGELEPIDLLLEMPTTSGTTDLVTYDLITGQINLSEPSARARDVYLSKTRFEPPSGADFVRPGQFRPCAVCDGRAGHNRSSVQDHQTKGDQPFQALITEQIHVQPPSAVARSDFAPLQGRKVLVFSDSRQTAARLAPNLQSYSMQDVMRPLIVSGYAQLQLSALIKDRISLEYLYLAVMLSAQMLGIRLRPALRSSEPFTEMSAVRKAVELGAPDDDAALFDVAQDVFLSNPPHALLRAIVTTITDRFYGLESLALASLCETPKLTSEIRTLPTIPLYAETDEQKIALARMWLRAWQTTGFHLRAMPTDWKGTIFDTHSGNFTSVERFLSEKGSKAAFKKTWLPELRRLFAEQMSAKQFQLRGGKLSLQIDGDWAYCGRCRETQRPYPQLTKCINCGSETVNSIDPNTDAVFKARKGYYRASTLSALSSDERNPMSLVAAEHTAQLNAAQTDAVFSKAEEHELLFQDVDLGPQEDHRERTAIDILSCTTTMEVGIDIGALSGVALRNMPPARSNYQQRAGRAGRRGTAIATVTAFGSADSHDEHYFRHPGHMIRGAVEDPILNVDNPDIARRHVTAFLLQRYHIDRLPEIAPEDQPHLFAVLGKVREFRDSSAVLNFDNFSIWLRENEQKLHAELNDWLPTELDAAAKAKMLDELVDETIRVVSGAIVVEDEEENAAKQSPEKDDADASEMPAEEGEEQPINDPGADDLLDRLLYKGILPRYAFPTDVATFHVFDEHESTRYRPVFQYAPSQGLTVALTQYAPGKQVWIDNRLWTSGSVYSPMESDRTAAWDNRWLYFECERCHYAKKERTGVAEKSEVRDCPACGGSETFGPARFWMRPPGFAHPVEKREGTSPDDQPARSYATRAKLAATYSNEQKWIRLNDQVRTYYLRDHLLVTNRGPKDDGYNYCTKCGRVEPSVTTQSTVFAPHQKPFPMPKDQACSGGRTATGIVFGTDFITDVVLMSIRVQAPLSLRPGLLSTDIALRTVCEATTSAACDLLKLEPAELQAEYRPALTEAGQIGQEAEIYIYDTLSGGAGFSRHVNELGDKLFGRALKILDDCPQDCDRSCYRCLRSYKNKFEHDQLDRFLGATLLQYMLDGGEPALDMERLSAVTNLLHEDLCGQNRGNFTITRNAPLKVPKLGEVIAPILIGRDSGTELVVAVHGGLTPDYAPTAELRELAEYSLTPVHLVDETLIRRNLPTATKRVLEQVAAG